MRKVSACEYDRISMTNYCLTHLFCRSSAGFDTGVFDAILPTTSCIIRGETVEERARALAKTGKTAQADGMFRYLGNMIYNGEELLRARQIQREEREKARQEKEDERAKEMDSLFEAAEEAYYKYANGDHDLSRLRNDDLKALIRFIVRIKKKEGDNVSKHKNATLMKERLAECDPCWTTYFTSGTESDGEDEVAGIDLGADGHDDEGEEGSA